MNKTLKKSKDNVRSKSAISLNIYLYECESNLKIEQTKKKLQTQLKLNISRARSSENIKNLQKLSNEKILKEKALVQNLSCHLKPKESLSDFIAVLPYDELKKLDLNEEEKEIHNEKAYNEHIKSTFIALKIIHCLPKPPFELLHDKLLYLNRLPECENRKTLIFDLDETLVHCVGSKKGNISLPITFPSGKTCIAGINLRPHLLECLEEAHKLFEVIVFAASHKCYADVILNYIDPMNKLIHHRIYRDNCIHIKNLNVKDLRIFANRRIQDIVIIDNSLFSFAFHLDNGVPIIS